MRRPVSFDFVRQVGLLAVFTASLAVSGSFSGLGIGARFALIGALHAAALALSIDPAAKPALGRRLLFVAVAAMLALATARLGLFGWQAVGGATGPGALLAACAALGALAYGASIAAVLGARLGLVPLGMISLGCAAATWGCFAVSRELHAVSVLWLAVPWWLAFSGGLWCAHLRSKPIR
jgi:hypothetical protein